MKILVLAGAGLVLALVIGFLATSQSRAEKDYCDNLAGLKSSLSTLVGSSSVSELQTNASAVQSAWSELKSSAGALKSNNSSSLDSAWSNFTKTIQSLPQSGSIDAAKQSITTAAQNLQSAVGSSIDSYDCSG
jgi:type VI protein secretion system component VasK